MTAIRLESVPAALAVPADGRLDGYGYAGGVLGAATANTVDGRAAGAGRQWWLLGLRWQVAPGLTPPADVSVAVTAGAQTTPLPLPAGAATSPDTGPLYWAITEPIAAGDVTVQVTSAGGTASFSLTHLRRTGPAPAVLYRTPGQWETVVAVGRTVTEPIPGFVGGPSGGLAIDLRSVTLSEYGPTGPNDTPPSGAGAWLNVGLSSSNSPSENTYFYNALTAQQVTLTLPGRAPLDATVTPGGGPDTDDSGVFPDRYAFPVPAGITGATLTVTPSGLSVGNITQPLATVNVAPAVFTITLPDRTTPPVAAGAVTRPRHYDTVGTAAASPAPAAARASPAASSRPRTAVLVLVVLAIAAAVAVIVVRGRRRRGQVTPAPGWATGPAWGRAATWTPPTSPTQPPPRQADSSRQPAPPDDRARHPPTFEAQAPAYAEPTGPGPAVAQKAGAAGTGSVAAPASESDGETGANGQCRLEPVTPTGSAVADADSAAKAQPVVLVMGPVRVEGWVQPPRRQTVVDLVVYLACHPDRPVSADRLRAVLSRADTDISDETLHSYVSHARRALGARHFPPAGDLGYQLVDVEVDWTRFQSLVATVNDVPADQARMLLGEALGLVRSRALPDGPGWADLENLPAVIDRAVTDTAARLARLHLDHDDPAAALTAAEVGLSVTPTDQACAAAALTAAGPTGRLTPTWERITRAWADADLTLPAELVDLRDRVAHPA